MKTQKKFKKNIVTKCHNLYFTSVVICLNRNGKYDRTNPSIPIQEPIRQASRNNT